MRFAAIADVHGNHLALEAVLADIRAQGIADIVNLGDMLSGPLDARRTVEILMQLDLFRRTIEQVAVVIAEHMHGIASRLRSAQRRAARLAAGAADDARVSRSGLYVSRDAWRR
ncbi:hypothetical protein ACVIWV_007940 [Bradyrhizobium diazoefficiens]